MVASELVKMKNSKDNPAITREPTKSQLRKQRDQKNQPAYQHKRHTVTQIQPPSSLTNILYRNPDT